MSEQSRFDRSSGMSTPRPDPTSLTTDALEALRVEAFRHVDAKVATWDEKVRAHRELVEAKLAAIGAQFVESQAQMDRRFAAAELSDRILADRVKETAEFHAVAHAREHEAHQREHGINESSLAKAGAAMDERLHLMNEQRAQIREHALAYVTREMYDARNADLLQRSDANTREIDALRAQNDRLQGILSVARFLGVGGIAIAVMALVLAFTGHPAA